MDFYLPLLIHAAKGLKQAVLKRSVFIPKAEGSRSEASSTGPKCICLEQVTCRRPLSVLIPERTHPEVYYCPEHIGPKSKQMLEFKTPLNKIRMGF